MVLPLWNACSLLSAFERRLAITKLTLEPSLEYIGTKASVGMADIDLGQCACT